VDEDDDVLDPMWEEDIDFGVNPGTPTVNYGIDPSTGRAWHNCIIDNTGELQNPFCLYF
jgi:hypothetical protein